MRAVRLKIVLGRDLGKNGLVERWKACFCTIFTEELNGFYTEALRFESFLHFFVGVLQDVICFMLILSQQNETTKNTKT